MGMLDARTDYPDGPSQPSDGSRASGLISPNAQHQTLLSAPFHLREESVGARVGPSPALHGAAGDTGLAQGPGVVSGDLAQFLDVPAIPETAVCSTVWQQARQCWGRVVPSESGRFGVLVGQSCHSSVSPLISFIAALLFSPVPYRGGHKSLFLPCC